MVFPVLPLSTTLSESDVAQASLTGALALVVSANSKIDELLKLISDNFATISEITVIANADLTADALIKFLDAGALSIAVTESKAKELVDSGVPAERIIIKVDELPAKPLSNYSGILISNVGAAEKVNDYAKQGLKVLLPNGEYHKTLVLDAGSKYADYSPAVPVVPVSGLTTKPTSSNGKISLSEALLSTAQTDRPDGLISTLVVDQNNTSLGLVYSSKESIAKAVETGTGVYYSRSRKEIWHKGATSGAVQKLLRIDLDCDGDCIKFVVEQSGPGFCHFNTTTCFGTNSGLTQLEKVLASRLNDAPSGSYTARLFNDEKLLNAKIIEEAKELCDAKTKQEITFEAADVLYFALVKLAKNGVTVADVEANLTAKSRKITRRKGDAKVPLETATAAPVTEKAPKKEEAVPDRIKMARVNVATASKEEVASVLTRPGQRSYDDIMAIVKPIVENVRKNGDKALLEYTAKFEKAQLDSPVLTAPFPPELMKLPAEMKAAIDLSFSNIQKFHAAQISKETMTVETTKGVFCSRFNVPIENVGLYVPGGTAVLPSTAMMLGVPAMVAGCKNIILASPPRPDGTLYPEIVYIADKVGAKSIVLAGGAQAIAALAYGTESVPKVDKVFGPGNQFVTAAKLFVQNDSSAILSIDLPAGPSEVLVIADKYASAKFVASDLLSQAEHGVDSQAILVAVDLTEKEIVAIEDELHAQASILPRVDILKKCLSHSTTILVKDIEEAMKVSNQYAPEHLIVNVKNASSYVPMIKHAGSVFVGPWSPVSCGDYSSGTNHTLPTYGYARSYSGVNTLSFMKSITSQELTKEGLINIGNAVMAISGREGLDAHRMSIKLRVDE